MLVVCCSSRLLCAGQVPMQDRQPAGSALRPAVMGPTGGVSTGHPLTTAAAFGILLKGGNAFDAGVASLIAGGVLEQDLYSLGGEALVLVYPKKENKVTSIVGQGWAPKAVDVDWYLSRNKTLDGAGLDPAVVPGALHAALTVLEKWGTMSFEEVAAPGIGYAENGFPMRNSTARAIRAQLKFFESWPDNKTYWLKPDGSQYKPGETIKLPALARTLKRMVEAERAREGDGPRRRHRRRARSLLQRRHRAGDGRVPAEARRAVRRQRLRRVLRAHRRAGEDHVSRLHRLQARLRQPGPGAAAGAQHPRELRSARRWATRSADYLHTVIEAMKLAYADRDTYYADPAFVQVPAEGLLSKAYAKERAALIDPKRASTSFIAGDPLKYDSKVKQWTFWKANVDRRRHAAHRSGQRRRFSRASSKTPRTWR